MKYKIFLLILMISFTKIIVAQQNPNFYFPKNFKDYVPQTIVIKFTAQAGHSLHKPFNKNNAPLSNTLLNTLKIEELSPYFSKESIVFKKLSPAQKVKRKTDFSLVYRIKVHENTDLTYAINTLRKQESIEYAEPVYINRSLLVPNDPLANSSTNPAQYHLKNIQAFDAWDIQTGSPSMKIGITDNSFDLSNGELSGSIPSGNNDDVADFDTNVSGSSPNSHGTVVALTSSATANNSTKGIGTAYNCSFLAVKVAPDIDLSAYTHGYEGILHAAQNGCKVVNMSWGRRAGLPSAFEESLLEDAVLTYDAVLIAAAGNDGNDGLFYPASYDDWVISVAGTNINDVKWSGSNYNYSVDISAPAENVVYDGTTTNTISSTGTSFAAPQVAGAAALIRTQYPTWDAFQVMARLKTTADNIDGLTDNVPYAGQLGKGRLNMHRALSDPEQAVGYQSYTVITEPRNFLFSGTDSDFVVSFKNFFDPMTNLSITLSCTDPLVTITDNSSIIGMASNNVSFDNTSDPFHIQIDANIPANTEVLFTYDYTDGSFTYTENVLMIINPSHTDINQVHFSVGDEGEIAVYKPNFGKYIKGITFQNDTPLVEAGLLIGESASKVSDAVRGGISGTFDNNFTAIQHYKHNYDASTGYLETYAHFDDIVNNPDRIRVEVEQRTYAWANTPDDNYMIIEYDVRNISGADLSELYTGVFANWDILDHTENLAKWDNANNMGYVYNTGMNRIYAGIKLLTDQDVQYYPFDDISGIDITDGFTSSEKFEALSNGLLRTEAGGTGTGTDVAHLLSARIFDLIAGQTERVAFAIVLGDDLPSIQATAQQALSKYQEINTGEVPMLSDEEVCKGDDLLINPGNGTTFNFYTSPPPSFAIHTGSALFVNNITSDRTYYVTNADSLYESDYATLNITLSPHTPDFMMSTTELNLAEGQEVSFTDNSTGASSWTWDFGNGQSSTSQNPPVQSYSVAGTYEIKLITENSVGCQDSISKNLIVYGELVASLDNDLNNRISFYPNPAQKEIHVELPQGFTDFTFKIYDTKGKLISVQNIEGEYQESQIDIHFLEEGLYLLELSQEKRTWQGKLLIKK